MNASIFAGVSDVEMQGSQVFHLISQSDDQAIYKIHGFNYPTVTVYDHRPIGLQALKNLQRTNDVSSFAPAFNHTSQIIVSRDGGEIKICLYPTEKKNSMNMLWVSVGIQDSIPVYKYIYYEIESMADGQYAFLSIYKRTRLSELQEVSPLSLS
jgi:hypothetical protein